MRKIKLISEVIDLDKSELLFDFKHFDPADWTLVRHSPPWQVGPDAIIGGKEDENEHGQIFYKTPVQGDIVMEFDAELLGKSYHDIIWWWATSLDMDPWGEGYLGCLGGWFDNLVGIEKSPDFRPSTISLSMKIENGRRYHIISGSIDKTLFIVVDGKMISYMTDPNPATIRGGHFGFGVFSSYVKYSNLKVYRPQYEFTEVGYLPDSVYFK